MAMFGKKKKKATPSGTDDPTQEALVEPTVVSGATATSPKKRRPATMLSSVVNETVPEAGIDVMKQNTAFALPDGKGWLGLLLCTDAIGGLSQKQKGDAAKGSIIELIHANKIQVVATKDMLDNEFLGLIPSEETLGRMDEYSLLVGAPYHWVLFQLGEDGQLVVDTLKDSTTGAAVEASYQTAVEISRGEKTLLEVLPTEVRQWAAGGRVDEPAASLASDAVDEELAPVSAYAASEAGSVASNGAPAAGGGASDDPMSDVVGTEVFDEEGGVDYSQLDAGEDDSVIEAFEAQFDESASFDDESDGFETSWQDDDVEGDQFSAQPQPEDDGAASYHQYVEANRDRVVDEGEVRDTIARRFLSTDLDLVVDLEEFNKTFDTAAPAILLSVANGSTDWLGSHIAQLVEQANAELERLHRANTDQLREVFVETMALHVEKTMSVVSTEAPGTQYYDLMSGAKAEFEEERAKIADLAIAQRREIMQRFEQAAESRAEQAAAHARATYRDKNTAKLENDLAEVEPNLLRLQEERFAHNRQMILDIRRKDAAVHMDVGTNRIFEHLREMRLEQQQEERELMERWNTTLVNFVDENRKHDIARAEVLAEELARTNQIDKLNKKHEAEVADLARERDDREERLRAELVRSREDALAELKARETEWQQSLDLEKERTRSSELLRDKLTKQLEQLDVVYETQYASKLQAQEDEKQIYIREQREARKAQRRTNRALIVLFPVITVAALGVGTIIGWGMSMGG